jgi:tetratricopeptide (TPR) repeat protein
MQKLSALYSAFLILAVISVYDAALAQKNLNCFNPSMPPVDVIAACDQNLASDPNDAQVYQARGAAWYRIGDYDHAVADFSQSIKIDPKYIRAFYSRGLAWEGKGNLDNALTDFKYFATLDHSFPDAQRAIARVTQALTKSSSDAAKPANETSDARSKCLRGATISSDDLIVACNEAIKFEPKKTIFWQKRGNAWYKEREYDHAISDYTEIIRLDPSNAKAFDSRGNAWLDKGDFDRAIADFNKQISLDPKNARGFGNRGITWAKKGDYDRAVSDYTEELIRQPKDSMMYVLRGNAWSKKADFDRAIEDYGSAIGINNSNASAYLSRGDAWFDKGDFDRAMSDYDEAVRLNPSSVSAYNNRGNLNTRRGDLDRAIADYSEVIKLDPKQAMTFFNRGLAWEKKKDLQRSLSDYTRSLEIDPSLARSQIAVVRVTDALKSAAQLIKAGRDSLGANVAAPKDTTVTGRRLALVIGNDSYQRVPQLEKAVGDADAVAAALKTIGFTVTEGTNLSFEQTARLIAEFEQTISKSDVVFFHFSGHGVQIKGDNILLPTDTPQPKDGQQSLVEKFGLSAESVIQSFNERGASLVVAVLDACRDNPFASSGTRGIGASRGLAALNPVEGTFVIYSAGVNQTALDKLSNTDQSPTSVFTRVLTPLLQEPNSLIEIAKNAQVRVRDLARTVGHEQTPAYYDQVVGNVRLVE